jgi:hypothetical protein
VPRTRPLFIAIWLCFLVRGIFYCTVFPVWEGFDEYAHFAYSEHVAESRELPIPKQTNIPRQVEESLKLAPLPRMMGYLPAPFLTHDQYWRLAPSDRNHRQQALRRLPHGAGQGSMILYEAQQPPLYYALIAPVYKLLASAPLVDRVWALRSFGLILASLCLLLGFLVARQVLQDDYLALCAAGLIAAMPEMMMYLCRVSNEPLVVVLASLLLLFTLRDQPLAIGVTLGLALLTKAYFLTAIPAVLLILLARRRVRSALLVTAIAAAISGWLFWRNWRLTGSISGVLQDAALSDNSRLGLLSLIPKVDWWRAIDSTFLSHIWFGNWSFLQVRAWMYQVFAVIFAIAAIGLVRRLRNPGIRILLVFYAAFLAGIAYHVLLTFASNGSSSSAGWYLYAFVAAEATLLVAGLKPMLLSIAAVCFAALELFGTHFFLIPYYTGLTAHQPNGRVPAAAISQLGNVREILARLAVNKPDFVSPPVIFILWLLFLAATLTLTGIILHSASRARAIK